MVFRGCCWGFLRLSGFGSGGFGGVVFLFLGSSVLSWGFMDLNAVDFVVMGVGVFGCRLLWVVTVGRFFVGGVC